MNRRNNEIFQTRLVGAGFIRPAIYHTDAGSTRYIAGRINPAPTMDGYRFWSVKFIVMMARKKKVNKFSLCSIKQTNHRACNERLNLTNSVVSSFIHISKCRHVWVRYLPCAIIFPVTTLTYSTFLWVGDAIHVSSHRIDRKSLQLIDKHLIERGFYATW